MLKWFVGLIDHRLYRLHTDHHVACCWLVICNYPKHISHKIHYILSNMTCCITFSSNIARIYNCDCSHNRDMWCSRIVIASKYHHHSPLQQIVVNLAIHVQYNAKFYCRCNDLLILHHPHTGFSKIIRLYFKSHPSNLDNVFYC